MWPRASQVRLRGVLRRLAQRAGVAHCAVEKRPVDAHVAPLRHADRKILSLLVDQPQGAISAGQVFIAHLRQRLENPGTGNPDSCSPAGRTILEVLFRLVVDHCRIAAEAGHRYATSTRDSSTSRPSNTKKRRRQRRAYRLGAGSAIIVSAFFHDGFLVNSLPGGRHADSRSLCSQAHRAGALCRTRPAAHARHKLSVQPARRCRARLAG